MPVEDYNQNLNRSVDALSYQEPLMAGDYMSVAKVSSDIMARCPDCVTQLDGTRDFAAAVNHLLAHGYALLHVGQETTRDTLGNPWQTTIAVLGKPAPSAD